MFPDSKIAQNYSCARTKTAAIIKHTLAAAANAHVIKAWTTTPFTILCDGGNDQYDKKYFGIMVRFWDDDIGRVVTQFLGMPVCNIATGQSLFDALSHELASRGIPWSNVIGFASDSASVMVGRRNSVLSRVCEQQPDVLSLGCLYHLTALCATAGLKTLPLSIDNPVDCYRFKHSSKRWHEFSEVLYR